MAITRSDANSYIKQDKGASGFSSAFPVILSTRKGDEKSPTQ